MQDIKIKAMRHDLSPGGRGVELYGWTLTEHEFYRGAEQVLADLKMMAEDAPPGTVFELTRPIPVWVKGEDALESNVDMFVTRPRRLGALPHLRRMLDLYTPEMVYRHLKLAHQHREEELNPDMSQAEAVRTVSEYWIQYARLWQLENWILGHPKLNGFLPEKYEKRESYVCRALKALLADVSDAREVLQVPYEGQSFRMDTLVAFAASRVQRTRLAGV